jgi:hypothetical protein
MATPVNDTYSAAAGVTIYAGRTSGLPMFDSVSVIGTDGTAPVTTAGQIMVLDLHATGAVTPVGKQHRANVSGYMAYDIYNTFLFNTVLSGVAGTFSLRPIDQYDQFPGNGQPRQAMHLGFWNMPANNFKLIHERRLDALMRWVAANITDIAPNKTVVTGGSMGAWGTLTFGVRRPTLFAALYPDRPRWRSGWTLGSVEISDYQTNRQIKTFATAPLLAAEDGGTKVSDYMDMIAYVSNTANKIPWIGWNVGRGDGYSLFQDHIDAVTAMRAAKRGFAFAWNNGDHGVGSIPTQITQSYPYGTFTVGKGYPLFTSHSLDQDPAVDLAGGINIGLSFRNVVETAGGWSCDVTSVLSACTVQVEPISAVYATTGTKKLATIPAANSWVSLSFP